MKVHFNASQPSNRTGVEGRGMGKERERKRKSCNEFIRSLGWLAALAPVVERTKGVMGRKGGGVEAKVRLTTT